MNDALRLPVPFGPVHSPDASAPGAASSASHDAPPSLEDPIEHIVGLLRARARLEPAREALRALSSDDGDGQALTCAGLDTRARAVAATLQRLAAGQTHGERGLLLMPTGLDYVAGFFGCLYAGAIAVPAFPPESARPQHLARVRSILHDAKARFVLTDRQHRDAMLAFGDAVPELRGVEIVVIDDIDDAAAADWQETNVSPADLAFLQYTSGSTSTPKGVMVSHANLMANEAAIVAGLGMTRDDTMVSWLPLYHDMGLIGGLLSPIYRGARLVLMSPQFFLERPVRWLRAIDKFGGTVSGGPDFAYRLCAQRIDAATIGALDLSGWRLAFSGSEPVRHDTLVDFCDAFAPAGFDPKAVYPCYGLAEATLFVTGGQRGDGMTAARFDRAALAQQRAEASRAAASDDGAMLVGCGTTPLDHDVRLMTWNESPDVAPAPVPAGGVGEIWVSGPSVAQGYWRNDEASARTFVQVDDRRWLRTGDLGFVHDDQLYITGRCKDVIIVRGHNLYPQDLEKAVEADVELVRKGRVTAFAVDIDGEPGIGIAAEVGRSVQKMVPPQTLAEVIAVAVADVCQQAASVVVLLNPGALPKTSSGKLQRSACARGWREGSLDAWATWQNGVVLGKDADVAPNASQDAATPQDKHYETVAAIWREVLGRATVNADDHFFLCGGSSLLAMQVLARVHERLGLKATLAPLYEHARLGDWVQALSKLPKLSMPSMPSSVGSDASAAAAHQIPKATPLAQTPDTRIFRQSFAQARLWFVHRLDPANSAAYHVGGQLLVKGRFDAAAFAHALAIVASRHDALRTTFDERDGVAVQIVHARADVPLTQHDLASTGDADAAAARLTREWLAQPFAPEATPPWRVGVLRTAHDAHRIVFVLHHLLTDAWSMTLLVDELARAYSACANGATPVFEAVPVQPGDHAHWQHAQVDGAALAGQLDWWQARLPEPSPVLTLPLDRARGALRSGAGHTLAFAFPSGLTRDVLTYAAQHKATPFIVLAASFQWLLHRYAGETDIRVGVPIAQRDVAGLERMLGCLVNTQVWRAEVDPAGGFDRLVAQVRDGALDAHAHRDAPFERVVERIAPQRSLGQSPLFQVMLNHHVTNAAASHAAAGWPAGLSVVAEPLTGGAQYDLALDIDERHEAPAGASADPLDGVTLRARLTFPTDLFDAQTIERLGADWRAGLATLLAQSTQPLASLDVAFARVPGGERRAGGALSADASLPFRSVPERVDVQAARQASAIALRDEAGALTYGELASASNRVAHWLLAQGVTPETRIGLAMSRQTGMIAGLLGIMKAGGAFVPLDPSYPAERLTQIIEDAGISLVLTEASLMAASWLPARGAAVATVADIADIVADAALPDRAPHVALHPGQLAYLIYTSGSTGVPKGVAVAHGPLAMHCVATGEQYRLSPEVCELHVLSINFDGAHERWMAPLICGASLFIADERHWAPQTMVDAMRRHGVTNAGFPTAYLCRLATSGATGAPALRLLSFGGEAMPWPALRAAQAMFRPAQTINGYGPTEAVMTPVAWSIDGDLDAQPAAQLAGQAYAPIGEPVGRRRAWVLDPWLGEVPLGAVGELYLGGEGVARGYLGRPALSAERFVPDPRGEPGARMYRTGDRVRRLADGTLVYLGRFDQQVKVRGFRIEPGEVETQLLREPGVDDALAVVAAGPAGDQLVAYVAGKRLDGEALRVALSQRLPDYLVPSLILVLDTLPKLPNGKRDRAALPAPVWGSAGGQAPQSAAEVALAALWQELLRLPSVSRDDNFFALGGDSIVALQMVGRARQAGWQVGAQDVFRHQTLARLAAQARAVDDANDAVRAPEPMTGDVPLTPVQAWFFRQDIAHRDHWNQWVEVRLPDGIDLSAVRDALARVVMHHDALRLRFIERDGQWQARYVAPHAADDLLWHAAMCDDAQLADLLAQAQRSLSIAHGPLLRALLVRTDTGALRCFLVAHHLVIDGVSWRILLNDWQTALARPDAALPCVGQSMRDWAQRWHDWTRSEAAGPALDMWRNALSGALDAIDVAKNTHVGTGTGEIEQTWPAGVALPLTQLRRGRMHEVLSAAVAHTLGKRVDARRYVVHVEGHGRDGEGQGDLSHTLGWFTAAWPLAVEVGATPEATLTSAREAWRRAPQAGASYGALRYLGAPQARATLDALPEGHVTVNFLGRTDNDEIVDGGLSHAPDVAPPNWLTLDVWQRGDTLRLVCRYDRSRLDGEDVHTLIDEIGATLRALAQTLPGHEPVIAEDFPHAGLSREQLAALPASLQALEAIVPATSMQQGLLFYAQQQGTSDPYFYQKGFVIDGRLDTNAFAQAWRDAIMQHAALRTAYVSDIGEQPLLLVHARETVAPCADLLPQEDWRDATAQAQHARLNARFAAERAEGFSFAHAHRPRLALVRVGEARWWLLWSSHHVALDGWSTGLVLSDVMSRYAALASDAATSGDGTSATASTASPPSAPTAPTAPSFAEFAVWQRELDATASLNHWRELLDGVGAPTPLPAAREPHARVDARGHGEAAWTLAPAQWQSWCDAARRAGVTPGTLCQGAWALLLARYAGLRDVVFGVTASGRSAAVPGIERMAGLFINTLPVRATLDPRRTVAQWLRDLQTQTAQSREHEHVALASITRVARREGKSEGKGEGADGALFESIVVFENYPLDAALLGQRDDGLRLSLLERGTQARNNYPLSLIVEQHDGLRLVLAFARERFDDAAVQALGEQFVALLGAVVQGFDAPLGCVGLRQATSRAAERTVWPTQDLLDDWHAHVARDGDALAAEGEDGAYRRAELDALANRLAATLQARGIGPEDRVAVCLPRSAALVAAILGIWKTGAAYVPLDPAQPSARLDKLVSASGSKAVIVDDGAPALTQAPVLHWNDLKRVGDAPAPTLVRPHPAQAAYVIYTSGSTGEPKGVVVSRGALHNYVQAVAQQLPQWLPQQLSQQLPQRGPDVGERAAGGFAMASTVAADLGHTTLFGALALGRALYLVPQACAFDAQRFAQWCASRPVDVLKIVPGHLKGLFDAAGAAVLPRALLITGGESLDAAFVAQIRAAHPALMVLNHYGPTETTVGALTHALPPDVADAPVPVGNPLANLHAYVLDADLNPVPPGVAGELYLGGAGLARGYLGAPAQTAERFVPDPWRSGERVYRTGDRAVQRADGALVYLGRMDDQVKIRGYRVEPAEVAQAMRRVPGVADAAVVARHDGPGGAWLHGAFTGTATVDAVRAALSEALPSVWVPARLDGVETLPLTANGKVDRRALIAMAAAADAAKENVAGSAAESARNPPHEGAEAEIAAIWREVLKREQVGRHDAFFEIGGDSILALQVIARLRKRGIKVGPQHLASHPTIAQLATLAAPSEAKAASPAGTSATGPTRGDANRRTFPLSSSQMRVWLETQMAPRAGAYHIAGALRLDGPLQVAALERALQTLCDWHDALRTTVSASDAEAGAPVQHVHATRPVAFTRDALAANLSVEARDAAVQAHLDRLTREPFDLAAGPLWRVHLMQVDEHSHVLMLVMHHLISDGWSMNLLIGDLARAYRAHASGATPVREMTHVTHITPVRYGDYAVWQREQLSSPAHAAQLAYWRTQLGTTHPELALPFDRARPAVRDGAGASIDLSVSPGLPARLDRFAREHGVTRFMVMAAAFHLLMHRVTGQGDVRTGLPVAGRTHESVEPVVGFFVNTQVLRSQIGAPTTFASLVTQIRDQLLAAQQNADVPFERLVEHLAPVRSVSRHPLFQVSINHQKRAFAPLSDLAGVKMQAVERRAHHAQVDLALDTEEDETGALRGWLTYACDVFDAPTVRRLGEQWLTLLDVAIAQSQTPVARLAMVPDAATTPGNGGRRVTVAVPMPVHLAIDAQAAARADAVAVSDADGQVTYADLVSRANRVAQALIRAGVEPEARVGLAMSRSTDLIVAMLGILKAGAAYVPLDPAYPAERLSYMVADAGVTHVITHVTTQASQAGAAWLPAGAHTIESILADDTLCSDAPAREVHVDQLAYVIYTSGSTGRPKGAQLTHRNLMRLLLGTSPDFAFDANDVWTMFHSYAFDFSVWEIFGALVHGARLVVVSQDTARDPAAMWTLVAREGVTVLNQTPSAFYQWLGAMPADAVATTLRHIVFGGEALTPARLAPWWQRFGEATQLTNMYGITETTVHVSQRRLRPEDTAGSPIGEPIADLDWRVLDAGLNEVPPGVAGDLYVCGEGLARGYLGQAGLTAERFVPDPKGAPGERMYRSGDRARRLADGTLDYLGRGDAQVKLRGFRIELGEIETQLLRHDDVTDAAVLVRDDGAGEQLVAYVVSPVEASALWPRLRSHLGGQLPAYMVPGQWLRLDTLPLTPNGKLDRRALPVPEAVGAQRFEAPHDGHEALIAAIWQDVLGVPRVGRHDDFFALGGHSLLATQVASRLRDALSLDVPLRTLFEASRLTALAETLDGLAAQAGASPSRGGATDDALQAALREMESLSPEALQALLGSEAR
ncbi:non-ribosomal peptide synthetase [Pandoraea anhela]|uniref:Linear gramicidin synthase subunit B n=1 Tax=Pandoraea anhela TaxID=2508295 RepID=A0A5E4WJP9_9BURK|nr:non-ribosomal peptide synthetase [Pandoraea anhela]VVE25297.1 Linear gramicidin synthase subunit B [Pandoraea anhela]